MAHIKFGLGHCQALEYYALLRRRLGHHMQIILPLPQNSYYHNNSLYISTKLG